MHISVHHLGLREHICPHTSCGSAFGYKHLLQRHSAKAHGAKQSGDDATSGEEGDESDSGTLAGNINYITGAAYEQNARIKVDKGLALPCPYPVLEGLVPPDLVSGAHPCGYVFSRAYDLRRHMRTAHNVEIDKARIDTWVKQKRTGR